MSGDEQALWQERIDVLKAAIAMGKPEAIQSVQGFIREMDDKLATLADQLEMIPQSLQTSIQQVQFAEFQKAQGVISRQIKFMTSGAKSRITATEKQIDTCKARLHDLITIAQHAKVSPREIDEGSTPEQAAKNRRRPDPIATLEQLPEENGISHKQALMARKIARMHQAITAASQPKVSNVETETRPQGGVFHAPDIPEAIEGEWLQCYRPWINHHMAHGPQTVDIVIRVAVFGISLDAIRRKHRLKRKDALAKLRDGLDDYDKRYMAYQKTAEGTGS